MRCCNVPQDFSERNLISHDFSGQNLAESKFVKANLRSANFSNASLINADFTEADLTDADFTNANLSGAIMYGAKLSNTRLFATDLGFPDNIASVYVDELMLANLRGIRLPRIDLPKKSFSKYDLTSADLQHANLMNSDHSFANFSSANLEGIKLCSCNLKNVNFSNANLKNADLSYSDLSGSNFSNANLSGANLTQSKIIDANFDGVDENTIQSILSVSFQPKLSESDLEVSQLLDAIRTVEYSASMKVDLKHIQIFPNKSEIGDVAFFVEAFYGSKRFAKLISGGNFDFYSNDSSAYVLSIRFKKLDTKLSDILMNIIRQTYQKRFHIFPSSSSIGAYWMTDNVNDSFASEILKKILINFVKDFYGSNGNIPIHSEPSNL